MRSSIGQIRICQPPLALRRKQQSFPVTRHVDQVNLLSWPMRGGGTILAGTCTLEKSAPTRRPLHDATRVMYWHGSLNPQLGMPPHIRHGARPAQYPPPCPCPKQNADIVSASLVLQTTLVRNHGLCSDCEHLVLPQLPLVLSFLLRLITQGHFGLV